METIKERAEAKVTENGRFPVTDYERIEISNLIDFAEEQRDIDIDKAWRWIEQYRNMNAHWTMEQMKDHFIKTMKTE